jgi:hypothetical protein
LNAWDVSRLQHGSVKHMTRIHGANVGAAGQAGKQQSRCL